MKKETKERIKRMHRLLMASQFRLYDLSKRGDVSDDDVDEFIKDLHGRIDGSADPDCGGVYCS